MEKKVKNLEKIIIMLLLIIAILLTVLIFQKIGIIENSQTSSKKLLNNGEITISEDGVVSQTLDSSSWDTSKVTATKDAEGKDVPVPKGYVGSGATGENKVNGGYVIYEGTGVVNDTNLWNSQLTRNQWVWVPVEDVDRIYEEANGIKKSKLYMYSDSGRALFENKDKEPAALLEWDTTSNLNSIGMTRLTMDKLNQELQLEFDETVESIKKYGGFYIGRYEVGGFSTSNVVIKRMNNDLSAANFGDCYNKIKYLAPNSNVKTNIIWGCLYDEVLEVLVKKVGRGYSQYMAESCEWGNFQESTFTYYNGSSNVVKAEGSKLRIPTGSSDYTKAFNIYDLSGNVWEWTLEGSEKSRRILRGGGYSGYAYQWPMSARIPADPTFVNQNTGARAYLYIK